MFRRSLSALFVAVAVAFPTRAPAQEDSRLKFSGDLRTRAELERNRESAAGDDVPVRFRPRIRFRLALDIELDDEFVAGARLVSGDPSDPHSVHQTLGERNESFAISLDRAFLEYTPDWAGGMRVTAGKFGHPFLSAPIYEELVLDKDVQPSGAALTYATPSFGEVALFLGVAHYLMLEQNAPEDADVTWTAGQLGLRWSSGRLVAIAAVEAHFFRNPTADGTTAFVAQSRGNRMLDVDGDGVDDHFESDFRIIQTFADITYARHLHPTLSGGVFENLGADRESTGWFAGASLGRGKGQYGGKLFFQVQRVQREAVFTPVSQDDFPIASGFLGIVTGVKFLPTDFLELQLWTLMASRDELPSGERGRLQQRYRADLTAKF